MASSMAIWVICMFQHVPCHAYEQNIVILCRYARQFLYCLDLLVIMDILNTVSMVHCSAALVAQTVTQCRTIPIARTIVLTSNNIVETVHFITTLTRFKQRGI